MRCANARIAVSPFLAAGVRRDYGIAVTVIPNGIGDLQRPQSDAIPQRHGLSRGRYFLTVARIDPQKSQLDLIEAYRRLEAPGWSLALAGAADYASDYSRAVAQAAQRTPGVVMLGHQNEAALAELYTHAGAFVLPSRQEGQPIAVIEALGYGCPLILSDIPAHRELGIRAAQNFRPGDVDELTARLLTAFRDPSSYRLRPAEREEILLRHDWRTIASQTLAVYRSACPGEVAMAMPGAAIRSVPLSRE
jgi:glycosyltransferase involved in cell wall biosynthesis